MTIHDILFTQGFDLVDIILSCVVGFILAADLFTDRRATHGPTEHD